MRAIARNFCSKTGRQALMALAMASLVVAAASAADAPPQTANAKGEADLAKMLKDRVPGKPVNCISILDSQNSTVIDHTAIVYDAGGTLYVNRPSNADQLDSNDIMVTRTSIDQLCRLDIVRLVDRGSHMMSGFVDLQDFVPYTRVPASPAH